MVEIYVIGIVLTFIISIALCRHDEKRYNSDMQYEMCAAISLFSWIGLIGLAIAYRNEIRTVLRTRKCSNIPH